jgi:hypothetical protein
MLKPGFPLDYSYGTSSAGMPRSAVMKGLYVYAASYDGAASTTLDRFYDSGAGALFLDWSYASVGEGGLDQSPSVEATGDVLFPVTVGRVYRMSHAAQQAGQLFVSGGNGFASSLLIDGATGDLVFGTNDRTVNRVDLAGTLKWSHGPYAAPITDLLLLESGAPGGGVLVLAGGVVEELDRKTGAVVWTHQYPEATYLPASVGASAGPGKLPTLYFVGYQASGYLTNLHAVVLDGDLDASSPWPKGFHDARNTSNAGAPAH